jgi:hypothetical protein
VQTSSGTVLDAARAFTVEAIIRKRGPSIIRNACDHVCHGEETNHLDRSPIRHAIVSARGQAPATAHHRRHTRERHPAGTPARLGWPWFQLGPKSARAGEFPVFATSCRLTVSRKGVPLRPS